jgi:hypothetical protein
MQTPARTDREARPLTGIGPRLGRRAPTLTHRGLGRPALRLPPLRARLGRRALTLAAGLAGAVPVIVATVKAVRDGWVPTADQAIISTRAYDVFTSHTPLVGQYSYAGHVTGKITYSLGPMLYWLLALPAHFGTPASITLTMGAVNTLAVVGVVALARRRGGVVLMFAAALAVALMCQSLAGEPLHDIWNPSAGLFPFTLLIFLCWSLACGEYRLLALTVLVASFVLQANLMYLAPAMGLLAVGFGGLVVSQVSPRRRRRAAATGAGSNRKPESADAFTPGAGAGAQPLAPANPHRRSLLRWMGAALAVAAICWSAPVIDQLSERPGNMTLVVQSATAPKATLGASVGWHAVVRAVGVRPWWLYVPVDRWQRQYDVRATSPTGAVDSCIALLAALLVAMLVALARRRRDVATGALIGFVLCGALAAVAAATPTPPKLVLTLAYTMWMGSQVGMWVWLMLAWSASLGLVWALHGLARARVAGFGENRPPDRARPLRVPASVSLLAPVLAGIAGVGATAAVAGAVAATEKPDEHRAVYRPTASLAASLDRAIPPGRTVNLVANLGYSTMVIKPALRYSLARHGVRALGRDSRARIGDWYELYNRSFQYVVYVYDGVRPPAKGARLIDRVRVGEGRGATVVSLWVSRQPTIGAAHSRTISRPRRRGRS